MACGKFGEMYEVIEGDATKGRCRCVYCGWAGNVYVLARSAHERSRVHVAAMAGPCAPSGEASAPVMAPPVSKDPSDYMGVMRELYDVERNIENATRWQQPKPGSVGERVLASNVAKRDRLQALLIQLKPMARAADRQPIGAPINFTPLTTYPEGCCPEPTMPKIPAFLLRRPPAGKRARR